MANELSLSFTLSYSHGNAAWPSQTVAGNVTVTGTAVMNAVQNIGTAEETLVLGDVSPSGYALFKNLDGTNYVELGKAAGTYVLKLKAGEFAVLRLDSWATIYAKANTAAVDLEYLLFSD